MVVTQVVRCPGRAFAGEAVERRLQALAQRLGCGAEMRLEA